jgi:hypothetical protein
MNFQYLLALFIFLVGVEFPLAVAAHFVAPPPSDEALVISFEILFLYYFVAATKPCLTFFVVRRA